MAFKPGERAQRTGAIRCICHDGEVSYVRAGDSFPQPHADCFWEYKLTPEQARFREIEGLMGAKRGLDVVLETHDGEVLEEAILLEDGDDPIVDEPEISFRNALDGLRQISKGQWRDFAGSALLRRLGGTIPSERPLVVPFYISTFSLNPEGSVVTAVDIELGPLPPIAVSANLVHDVRHFEALGVPVDLSVEADWVGVPSLTLRFISRRD
jgi:hypothetical protein